MTVTTRHNEPEVIRRLLSTRARWAVVGLSHPRAETAHGAPGYPRLGIV